MNSLSKIKYSIVLPVLNGAVTLQYTFPEMLKIDRDDIEFVVCNNLSDDKTKEVILDQKDKRVKYLEPEKRLPLWRNFNFTYSHAEGEWQGHIGHDDHLLPSRFEVTDEIIKEFSPQLIKGEALKYKWPNYPQQELSNTFHPCFFDKKIKLYTGSTLGRKLINQISIPAGGNFFIHKSILESINRKLGNSYTTSQEFFIFRAAALLSNCIVYINTPFYIQGYHTSSGGTQILSDKKLLEDDITWDKELEWTDWKYCPFKHQGYLSVSMNAAMQICDVFKEELNGYNINKWYWLRRAEPDIAYLIDMGQLPPKAIKLFYDGLKTFPLHLQCRWYCREMLKRTFRKFVPRKSKKIDFSDSIKDVIKSSNSFGWNKYLRAKVFNIHSMKNVPVIIENYFDEDFHFNHL